MKRIWQIVHSYIWWTHDRGSIPYDVMVTLILVFIFLSPLWINFRDKPAASLPHHTEIVVTPNGSSGYIYKVDAAEVTETDPAKVQEQLEGIIRPISGEVVIRKVETVRDSRSHIREYRVWVARQ